jgi:hypothetical protein
MQMGTRWDLGQEAPASLPPGVLEAIVVVENDLAQLGLAHPDFDITGWRWTLTWLEGRPVVELDDGTTIRVDTAGVVTVSIDAD